ncbi:MAG: hypothetical protein A2W90_02615 [Bacteroidetes bacterium GWF2_42_66]|nr:MAG: hypothetical protein A2W92_19655 [Bacteroidetes bacterium GWA2_42_15]OFY01244.1 MAG: hypothetical protein A2W89_16100 [Bacteroidetes bacterium GWE2_42_39]OFY42087.1 MAG: hypothetical protein A2W90_02615 [Bacteroidetes bacterium GWF2_42_66]HBL77710.1 hypothetical protein [Prolixibacteraceae bacterium]HCB62839.1 hypothetical protein [Bacteroidales bacterium]
MEKVTGTKKPAKLTNAQVKTLLSVLSATDFDNIEDGKFAYSIQRNIDRATSVSKTIDKAVEAMKGKELQELEKKHAETVKEAANKFLEGKTRYLVADLENVITNAYATTADADRIKVLRDKFIEKHDKFINETCADFEPYKLDAEYVQKLPLKRSQMAAIMPIITE